MVISRLPIHSLAQIPQPTAAAHLWQSTRGSGERDGVGELSVKRVVGQAQVVGRHLHAAHLRGAAIAARHDGRAGNDIAVAQVGVGDC